MATLFSMPKLGLNMTEGVIVSWLINEGDLVKEGEPILEIETDKATQEVEAPASGVLAKILRHEGDEVPCNYIIAVITEEGEQVPDDIPDYIADGVAPTSELQSNVEKMDKKVEITEEHPKPQRRISISPSARVLAQDLGVDITKIKPSGNRIKRSDVEAAHKMLTQESSASSDISVTVKPMSTMRKKIADAMLSSVQTTARVGLNLELDVTNLIAFRNKSVNEGTKISYNVLLAQKAAEALKKFPYMNSQIREDKILEFQDIHIGIAVDSERGLIVPVLRSVDKKDLVELQEEYSALTARALQAKSTLEDLEGATFTITNLGNYDIETFFPIINLPECAILGVGAIIEKPVAQNGQVVIKPRMNLTLAFDHRLVDGAQAANFLNFFKLAIQKM